jgi:hypothetical protein
VLSKYIGIEHPWKMFWPTTVFQYQIKVTLFSNNQIKVTLISRFY